MKNVKIITLFLLSFVLFSNYLIAQIESEKDSLESLLPYAKDYQRVDIYIALADLVKQTDTSTAINYAQQSFKISNKISYAKGLAGSYIILGFIDRSRSDYKNAKTKYLYAISYAIKSNDLNTISWAYQNMGNLYFIQSDYSKAMRYYMGALSKGEKSGNQKRIALAYNQIGSLYMEIKDTFKAEFYYSKAYSILKTNGDEISLARISNNLGNIFKYTHNEMRALYYYSQCLEVFKKHNLQSDISTVLNNIGMIYLSKRNFKKAFQFVNESYQIDKQKTDYYNTTISSLNLSSIYFELNKIDSALYFSMQSLKLARENKYSTEYNESCKQLSKIYEKLGDNEKALFYSKESNKKDILDANKGAEIENIHSSYEKAKKDQKIKLLDAENRVKEINILDKEESVQHKNTILLALICVIVFLVLITILFFYLLTQKKKRKTLEVSLAAKNNILHRINQELRTPLNSLMNYSYLANESKNLTELREYLSGINASGSSLSNSMNNIVSYLQIDSKNDVVVNTPFNLNETLQSIFKEFQVQCSQKNILFSQLISPDLPRYINADKNKITTIIQNVLCNSLKFSEKGVIKIEIKLLKTFQNQDVTKGRISVSIIDEGHGLKGKDIKDLLFTNLKKNTKNDGFGLGLFIVNDYVKKLNGRFELVNNEIAGCTANVEFDIEIDESSNHRQSYNLENKIFEKLNVLLVENDLTNAYTLQKILERKGYQVNLVSKGQEVFTLLQSSNFDIVLIDVCLHDMNGIELTKLIRLGGEFSADKDIPIIGLSANADPIEMKESLAVGMNDYITKPINIELLLHKMNEPTSNKTQELYRVNS
ncbi:MAG: tetratricopeptide repeat protein [Bacteroidia bacterium]|nr:tetratricopeptide repeat protein [Bacteroidia bacterium]